ncbi:MAG: YkgJ family cysteine cluster protein [Candidatus Micrarchaeota archaeon]
MESGSGIFPQASAGQVSEPCASCGVKCCNRFAVPITGFDLVRLIEKTGLVPHEFCHLADAKNIEAAPHSLVFIFVDGKLEERLLSLKRKKNMYCIFSNHSKGCGVWGAHPFVCRAYPFTTDERGEIKYVKNFVCPRKWEKGEYVERVVKKVVAAQNQEIAEYNKIVRKWNAQHSKGGSEGEFFEFLLKESRARMAGE